MVSMLPILALAAMSAGAGPAQKPAASDPRDIKMMHDLARCVADRKTGEVRRLLALDYRTEEYDRSMRRLARDASSCSRFLGSLKMARVLMAGSLAEAMLAKSGSAAPLSRRLVHDPSKPAIPARDEGEYLGLCAARTMPEAVEALLATSPESDAEKSSIAKIAPNLSQCVQAGASARVNRHGLRALLALAAYRLTTSSSAGAPPPAEG